MATLTAQDAKTTAAGGSPTAAAPVDLTGVWVSVVSEDWLQRMLMPPRGDYAGVPLSLEGRRVANLWDPANQAMDGCKPFGAPALMRIPAERSWQGYSHAEWEQLIQRGGQGGGLVPPPPRAGRVEVDAVGVRTGARQKMIRRATLWLTMLTAALAPAALVAQAADPLVGVWNVDIFKSTYVTGQPPVRRVIAFDRSGDALHFTQETTNQGFNTSETIKIEFTAKLDGKDYPIMNSGLDTVALKKIDATTYERVGKIKGMPTETATMKLSNRNRTLTITTKGTTDTGAEYSRIEVFNKQ